MQRPAGEPAALSPQQRQLWTDSPQFSALYRGPPPRNQSVCLLLRGELDHAAFSWAFARLVDRHETLRMDFPVVDGQPSVRIAEHVEVDLRVTELNTGPVEQRQLDAVAIGRAEAETPFVHQAGPLFRVRLFRLDRDRYVLFFMIDHILFDGWSFGVFVRDLSALYTAKARGLASELRPLALRYSDYAYAENQRLTPEYVARTLAMWRDALADLGPQPDLAGSRRTAPQPFRLGQTSVAIGPDLTSSAIAFSRANGVSLFATLLGAFKINFWRASGADDITAVSQTANRPDPALYDLIGKFSNSVVTRTGVERRRSFRESIKSEFQGLVRSLSYQDFPYSTLHHVLFPQGDPTRLSFGLQNYPMPPLELGGLRLKPIDADFGASLREMAVTLFQDETGVHGTMSFNAELHSADEVETLCRQHFELLARGLNAPDLPIGYL